MNQEWRDAKRAQRSGRWEKYEVLGQIGQVQSRSRQLNLVWWGIEKKNCQQGTYGIVFKARMSRLRYAALIWPSA